MPEPPGAQPVARRVLRAAAAGSALLVLAVGTVLVHDAVVARAVTWEPVERASSLGPGRPPPFTGAPEDADRPCPPPPRRWMVIGWDGADWSLLRPLLAAGKMPHLQRLLRSATAGSLATFEPTESPAIWTTVATGVAPRVHGIRAFYNQPPRLMRWALRLRLRHFGSLRRKLFDNSDRQTSAVWNQMTRRGRTTVVAGYHNTFPVEPIRGAMLSNYLIQEHISHVIHAQGVVGDTFAESLVHPPELAHRVAEIQETLVARVPEAVGRFVHFSSAAAKRDFLHLAQELHEDGDSRPYFATHAWLFDEIYHRAAVELYRRLHPDLLLLHQQAIDLASHQFLNFHAPEAFEEFDLDTPAWREVEAARPLYRDTVAAVYQDQDRKLGELMDLRGEDTGLLLISDHGFEAHDAPTEPGYHDHAPPGILVLDGPGVVAGERLEDPTVYDVLPTLAAAMDLPVADDWPGRVLTEAFCDPEFLETVERVTSWGEADFVPVVAPSAEGEERLLRQLETLGYLD